MNASRKDEIEKINKNCTFIEKNLDRLVRNAMKSESVFTPLKYQPKYYDDEITSRMKLLGKRGNMFNNPYSDYSQANNMNNMNNMNMNMYTPPKNMVIENSTTRTTAENVPIIANSTPSVTAQRTANFMIEKTNNTQDYYSRSRSLEHPQNTIPQNYYSYPMNLQPITPLKENNYHFSPK